jgi:hypothetical protein
MIRYQLFRGETLLGWFESPEEAKRPNVIVEGKGYLHIDESAPPIESMMQTAFGPLPAHLPLQILHQHPLEPHDIAKIMDAPRPARSGVKTAAVAGALERQPPAPPIPAEHLYRIGMPDGSLLLPQLLQIHEWIVPQHHQAATARQAGLEHGPFYMIVFGVHDMTPPP